MCLPDSCHGNEGPPESFTNAFCEACWKFIRVTCSVLKTQFNRYCSIIHYQSWWFDTMLIYCIIAENYHRTFRIVRSLMHPVLKHTLKHYQARETCRASFFQHWTKHLAGYSFSGFSMLGFFPILLLRFLLSFSFDWKNIPNTVQAHKRFSGTPRILNSLIAGP